MVNVNTVISVLYKDKLVLEGKPLGTVALTVVDHLNQCRSGCVHVTELAGNGHKLNSQRCWGRWEMDREMTKEKEGLLSVMGSPIISQSALGSSMKRCSELRHLLS